MNEKEVLKENPSAKITESEWIKDYNGIDVFGLDFSIINRQLPLKELDYVITTDFMGRKVFEACRRWIIPVVILAVAGLIQV